jgi:hypothetical protein
MVYIYKRERERERSHSTTECDSFPQRHKDKRQIFHDIEERCHIHANNGTFPREK